MKAHPDLTTFLEPYDPKIQQLAIELRDFITKLVPNANELIWDNYNAVAMAYSTSKKLKDAFCHIAVYSKHVNVGFNRGSELVNLPLKLEGTGKLIRHFSVKEIATFPKKEITQIIWEAIAIAERRNPELLKQKQAGESVVMSVSKKKVRPNKSN